MFAFFLGCAVTALIFTIHMKWDSWRYRPGRLEEQRVCELERWVRVRNRPAAVADVEGPRRGRLITGSHMTRTSGAR